MAADDDLAAGDAAILDALYRDREADDLDPAQRSTVDELASLRGLLRQARDDGFEVEAPEGVAPGSMASLMAAARAHAAPRKPGLWARLQAWMMPMVAHPALAGAAAVVVIGGTAGVLYLRGKTRIARPPAAVTRPAPAPTPPPSPITEGELGDVLGKRPVADRPGPARIELPPLKDGPAPTGIAPNRGPQSKPKGDQGGRGDGGGPGQGRNVESFARDVPEKVEVGDTEKLDERPQVTTGGAFGQLGGASNDTVKSADDASEVTGEVQTAPPPPPPPPPPKKTAPEPPAPDDKPQVAPDDGAAQRARVLATQLTARARTAARANDCATVAALGKQVASADPAYHRDVFVRDPDIARCR